MKDPLAAIDALRRGATGAELDQALAVLYGWLDAHHDRKHGHSEFRQRTVIKAYRRASRCRATDRRGAEAWLNRIYLNVVRDAHRARRRDPLAQNVDAFETLDRLAAESGEPATAGDEEELPLHEEWLFDELDRWLAGAFERPGPRQKARTQAEVAWERHIRQASPAVILAELTDPPATATLYKWVERGREKVLLPFVGSLLAGEDLPPPKRSFCAELQRLLQGARRADAGKPRHGRRARPPVSPEGAASSVQYDEPPQDAEAEGDRHE